MVPPVDLVLVLLTTVLSAYEDRDEIDVIVIEAEVILRMMIVDIRVCVIGIADIDVNFVEVYAPLLRVTVLKRSGDRVESGVATIGNIVTQRDAL